MRGRDHFAIGVVTGLAVCGGAYMAGLRPDPTVLVAAPLVVGLGGIAPDMDHPYSLAGFRLPLALVSGGLFFIAVPFVFGRILMTMTPVAPATPMFEQLWQWGWILVLAGLVSGALSVSAALLGHRGPTHSLVFAIGAMIVVSVSCALVGLPWWYGMMLGLGWLTHLAADARTRMGLPALWWPFDSVVVSQAAARSRPPVTPAAPPRSESPEIAPVVITEGSSDPLCPLCGVRMVIRTARRGEHTGQRFYGCANFPRCRRTLPIGGLPD